MGSRNPDRVPLTMRYRQGRTVGDMLARRWDVISKCQTCELVMQVDLALIAKVSGPDTILWNRKPRCRRMHCAGFVEFRAKAPGMGWHEPLAIDDREPSP